jgi:hypothetical protein
MNLRILVCLFVHGLDKIYEISTVLKSLQNWELTTVSSATKSRSRGTACFLQRQRQRERERERERGGTKHVKLQNGIIKAQPTYGRETYLLTQMEVKALFRLKQFKWKA